MSYTFMPKLRSNGVFDSVQSGSGGSRATVNRMPSKR